MSVPQNILLSGLLFQAIERRRVARGVNLESPRQVQTEEQRIAGLLLSQAIRRREAKEDAARRKKLKRSKRKTKKQPKKVNNLLEAVERIEALRRGIITREVSQ
jgi:hypothetical protein